MTPFHALQTVVWLTSAIYVFALLIYLLLRFAFGDKLWWLGLVNTFAVYLFLPLLVILPLALIMRSRWIAAVGIVLVMVASGWAGPYFLPKTVRASSGPTLKVVTFNVLGDNRNMDQIFAWLRKVDADVVLMQETPDTYRNKGIDALRDLYPYQLSQDWHWSNTTLSKYPFDTKQNLPRIGQQRFIHQKVTITLNGQSIAIYNFHFTAPSIRRSQPLVRGLPSPMLYDDSLRDEEIRTAMGWLEAEKGPYLFGGDFNMSSTSAMYSEVAERGHDSFLEAGSGLGTSWPAPGSGNVPSFMPALIRIDYIWHSPHFCAKTAEQGPASGSDHLPLVVALEWCK